MSKQTFFFPFNWSVMDSLFFWFETKRILIFNKMEQILIWSEIFEEKKKEEKFPVWVIIWRDSVKYALHLWELIIFQLFLNRYLNHVGSAGEIWWEDCLGSSYSGSKSMLSDNSSPMMKAVINVRIILKWLMKYFIVLTSSKNILIPNDLR